MNPRTLYIADATSGLGANWEGKMGIRGTLEFWLSGLIGQVLFVLGGEDLSDGIVEHCHDGVGLRSGGAIGRHDDNHIADRPGQHFVLVGITGDAPVTLASHAATRRSSSNYI